MARKSYVLTIRAETDLRETRAWSRVRWGRDLTKRYFDGLHKGAQYVAENHATGLSLYLVREHYLVYEPLAERFVAIVAVIRPERDMTAILQMWAIPIQRELAEIRSKIERGEIRVPAPRRAAKSTPKKQARKK